MNFTLSPTSRSHTFTPTSEFTVTAAGDFRGSRMVILFTVDGNVPFEPTQGTHIFDAPGTRTYQATGEAVVLMWLGDTGSAEVATTTTSAAPSDGFAYGTLDGEPVRVLPLAGGTMDEGATIGFQNGSSIGAVPGGDGLRLRDILNMPLDYVGGLQIFRNAPTDPDTLGTVKLALSSFTDSPAVSDDETKGYNADSIYVTLNGDRYQCTDNTADNAVWVLVGGGASLTLTNFSGVFAPKMFNLARDLRTVIAPAPTVTSMQVASHGTASGLISGGILILWNDPRIVLRGAQTWTSDVNVTSIPSGGLTGVNNELMTTAEFIVVGDSFEINWVGLPLVRRIWIDGRLLNSNEFGQITNTILNVPNVTHFQFTTHAERRIKIENFARVRGVRVSHAGCIKAPHDIHTYKPTLMVVGDSICEGTGGSSSGHGGFTSWLGEMLNATIVRSASGSTGLTTDGVGGRSRYIGRIQDVRAIQPEVLLLWISINDSSNAITQQNVFDYVDAVTRVSPRTRFIIVGPLWTSTPVPTIANNTLANDATCRAAAAARGIPYISAVETGREWFTAQNRPCYLTGTQATPGTVTRVGNAVTAIAVATGGQGYTTRTRVCTITGGGGTGAAATANITLGVGAVNIIDAGSGMADGTYDLLFSPVGATGTATVSGGAITSYTITNSGTYTSEPTVTLTGLANNNSFGLVLAAQLVGEVTSITVTAGGSGYTSSPTVTIPAPGGDGTHPNASGHDLILERLTYEIKKLLK